jgi:beta-glucosidase
MNYVLKTSIVLMSASLYAFANLASVTVPATMIHPASPILGLGATAKVEYVLSPEAYDSVFVTLAIKPATGGTAIALKSIKGDTGIIRVNTVTPGVAKTYSIFFEFPLSQTAGQYIAEITANPAVSALQTDVNAKLNSLTKAQKAQLCAGGGDGFEGGGAGTSIPWIYMSDGPHGIRPPNGGQATCFPADIALACTWDTALARIQGKAIGEESRSFGFNCLLGPNMDLVYHPLAGGASMNFSEDPYLSGKMAAANVWGIQSMKVIATLKHLGCYNKEDNHAGTYNAVINERTLQETYLYNFKICIDNTDCWGIMGAYNLTNGIPSCENKFLLTDNLRTAWGYRSLVMTDWGTQTNLSNMAATGADIQMPVGTEYTAMIAGMPDSIVNMHASRIIYAHEKIGDLLPDYSRTAGTRNNSAHDSIARLIGANSIVLARNVDNLLPIPKTGKKIAIIGPYSTLFRPGPGGSSVVTPWRSTAPAAGISNYLRTLEPGVSSTTTTDLDAADYILVFVGANYETEGMDRPYLLVQPNDGETVVQTALAAVNGPNKTIVIYTGGSASTPGYWSSADVKGIVIAFYPGQEQGAALADVLFGNVNPSGKLPVTFPADGSQLPNWTLFANKLQYPASDSGHGYFRVNKLNKTPLFAFGHGLSYTTFAYSNLQIFPPRITAGDRIFVRATVTNTGSIAGKEAVQLYLSMPQNAGLPVRVQELRGFRKVSLDPGQSTIVSFELTKEEMQVFRPGAVDFDGTGKWDVLKGSYGVRVGTSSQQDMQPTLSGSFMVE